MLCMFLEWEELSRVPTVSTFRDGGEMAFHTSHVPFLCIHLDSLWKYGPP